MLIFGRQVLEQPTNMANRQTVCVQTNGLLLFLDWGNESDMVFLLLVISWDYSSGRPGPVIEGEEEMVSRLASNLPRRGPL